MFEKIVELIWNARAELRPDWGEIISQVEDVANQRADAPYLNATIEMNVYHEAFIQIWEGVDKVYSIPAFNVPWTQTLEDHLADTEDCNVC